jgi:hypothetical protein
VQARIAAALLALSLGAGCGLPGAPQPPSLELPKPVHDLRAERRGNRVTLTWSTPRDTTDRQRVRRLGPIRICRSIESLWTPAVPAAPASCTPLADVGPNESAGQPARTSTYVDTLPDALTAEHSVGALIYTVEALNTHGRSAGPSNPVEVPLAPTLPPPDKVVTMLGDRGPDIAWTVPTADHNRAAEALLPQSYKDRAPVSFTYRIYRQDKDRPRAQEVAISTAGGFDSPRLPQPNINVVDSTAEWEHTYIYRVAIVTRLNGPGGQVEIEGDASPPVEVFNHDTFPPPVPSGVQAVFTESGEQRFIDVTWLPSDARDVGGYNVYRREEGGQPVKLTPEPVKTPTFRDTNVAAGRTYWYSVSAVDVRGNQSARSAEASERVPERP